MVASVLHNINSAVLYKPVLRPCAAVGARRVGKVQTCYSLQTCATRRLTLGPKLLISCKYEDRVIRHNWGKLRKRRQVVPVAGSAAGVAVIVNHSCVR